MQLKLDSRIEFIMMHPKEVGGIFNRYFQLNDVHRWYLMTAMVAFKLELQ